MPWLDPIGGAMVGYTILKAGYDICRDAMREALDVLMRISLNFVAHSRRKDAFEADHGD